jgi:hypothetical protein
MIKEDSSLEVYRKQVQKNKDWKPQPDERRMVSASLGFYRDNCFTKDKVNYFDKMLEILKELGAEEYPAACLLVGLYLEAEKHGNALDKLVFVYKNYLKETGDSPTAAASTMIRMVQ